MLYAMFVKHSITPSDFWNKPIGEQKLLLAFTEQQLEDEENAYKKFEQDSKQKRGR